MAKSRPSLTKILVLLALVAVGGGLVWYFKLPKKGSQAAPQYMSAKVTRGNLSRSVVSSGQLAPWVSVEVSTQISGIITEVNVDFNSRVKKGEVLAKVDPSSYEQKLKQAQANLAASEANERIARLRAERQKALRTQELITQSEAEDAEAQLQQASSSLLSSRAAVENAQLDLDRCTLTSPIDGTVIFKAAEVGKTVAASLSAPTLFAIAEDLKRLQIVANVTEVDILTVKVGQPIVFSVDALPNRTFKGTLRQIRNPYTPSDKSAASSAGASNTITTFNVVIEVDNSDLLLRPSLTADVSIVTDSRSDVLLVPNTALRFSPPGARAAPAPAGNGNVYRFPATAGAAPELAVVKLGLTDSMFTEVISGLAEGDAVVTGVVEDKMAPFRGRPR